jgi:predicted ATP-grasp superfamily ATP-dependent carboligase
MSVLITGSGSPKALTVIRSLGKKGISVTAAADTYQSLGRSSRYSSDSFCYPSPLERPVEYLNALKEFLRINQHDVLLPVHSEDTYLIAEHKETLGRYTRVPLHDYARIREVNDKSVLAETSRELGIAVPATYIVKKLHDLHQIARIVEYPIVIKMRDSSGSRGVLYATSEAELRERFMILVKKFRLKENTYPIIQEYISGDGYGVSLLYNNGDLRAYCTHKRIREYPISGGPSTLRESTINAEMEKIARDLMEYYAWHGVAMVEFKLRSSDKKPVLIEVNPRFWGSINLSVLAGVDFPYLLYQMAMKGDVDPVLHYKVGVQSRNCFADLLAMAGYLYRTGHIKNLKETRFFPFNDDIFSTDDPKPALQFLQSGFRHVIRC